MGFFGSRENAVQRELESQRPQIQQKRSSAVSKTAEQLRLLDEMERLTFSSADLAATERRIQFQALSLAYNLAAAQTLIELASDGNRPEPTPKKTDEPKVIFNKIADALIEQQQLFWSDDYLMDMNSIGGTAIPPSIDNKSTLMAGTISWSLFQAGRDGASLEALQVIALFVGQRMERHRYMTEKFFIEFVGYIFRIAKQGSDDTASLRNVSSGIMQNLTGTPQLLEENREEVLFCIAFIEKGLEIGYDNSKEFLAKLRF